MAIMGQRRLSMHSPACMRADGSWASRASRAPSGARAGWLGCRDGVPRGDDGCEPAEGAAGSQPQPTVIKVVPGAARFLLAPCHTAVLGSGLAGLLNS